MIGETIGHFKIVSRLGRGGMGEVYAGEHESIQTRVAIKVLHAEISRDTEHVQRFFNEAKIVGKIKHAGIVKIFDVGFYKDHAYLVMELLEGEPLSARIERANQIGWREAADIGRQIANVLDATHRAGVIHRDLKPDNIFLVPDHELASGERVKILDFGISKLSGTMAGNSPKTVGTMGTPAYMAPEQWGDSATIDWRADAYSLGCVQFEMVCGRPPFVCNTIFEACGKHMHSQPPPPHDFAELPGDLDALVLRLLAKDPAERAVSMSQVARELEAIATGKELAAIPVRRAASQPAPDRDAAHAPTVTPQHPPKPARETLTTLGSSAAELVTVRRSKRTAFIGGGIAAAAVLAIVIVAVAMGGGSSSEAPAQPAVSTTPVSTTPAPTVPAPPTATAPSATAPAPTPTPPAPTPTAVAPTPPPTAGSAALGSAGSGAPLPVATKPTPKPPHHTSKPPPPVHSGSDATVAKPPTPPPPQGSNAAIGGRI